MRTRLAGGLVIAGLLAASALGGAPASGVAGFGDVGQGRYYTEAVQWLVTNEITTGVSPTCFAPDDAVTRGEAAAFLWRMEGRPTGSPDHGFADVAAPYQQEPVAWMRHRGLTTGTSSTTYEPDRDLSRAEFAAMLHRLAGSPPVTGAGFPDVASPWAIPAVAWMVANDITTGTGPHTFSPDAPATRGQLATFLHRYKGAPPVTVDPAHPAAEPCTDQAPQPPTSAPQSQPRPNIVVIITDDLRADEMEVGFGRGLPGHMSALETELIDKGMTLPNFFATTPLCCPSRASFLTGQYAHNHGVLLNGGKDGLGGLRRFYDDDRDLTSLGTWLQGAGYTTALVGKYLNGYPDHQGLDRDGLTESYVPRGWDEWYGSFANDAPYSYYDFRFNENGTVVEYADDYLTSVEQRHATDFIRRRSDDGPFLLYLTTYAPHGPYEARPDHAGRHFESGTMLPTRPSCAEADVSDKPAYIRDLAEPRDFGACTAEEVWSRRLDMTLATDELVGAVIDELEATGVADNTWIFFTSDNGLLRGEHRIGGKSAPYEESIRIPLVVRGPGVAAGVELDHLTLNIDLAPTLLALADAGPLAGSPPIDGESLVDVLSGETSESDWRDGVLIELLADGPSPIQPHVVPPYAAVRTRDHVYVEYATGETELYDLTADPFQLDSIHDSAPSALVAELDNRLEALRDCSGDGCHAATRSG